MKWLGLLGWVFLAGCASTPTTDVDYDVEYDFGKLKTFAFQPPAAEPASTTTLYTARIKDAVVEELTFKGFEQTTVESADFIATYHLIVDTRYRIDNYYNAWGYHSHWRGGMHSTSRVREYKVGTLVIDMIDNATKTVFWRGSIQSGLRRNLSPEERGAMTRQAVQMVLQPFPLY